jgi:FHA domain
MSILDKARQLETIIARTFNDAAQRVAPAGSREPLELVHEILESIEEEVEPAGRGTHVFPFNRLKITVVAPTRDTRARFEAVFDGSPTLHQRILNRLHAAGCEAADLSAKVVYVAEAATEWEHPQFHVEFVRAAPVSQPVIAAPPRRRLHLAVIGGTADTSTVPLPPARIDIGRCAEVRDHRHRMIRTNHVAFADEGSGVNETVSRCHAHVEYHHRSGDYRVYDDRSAHGTGVVRHGRTILVSPGSRGVRLLTGDEIVLGEARLRVTIDDEA